MRVEVFVEKVGFELGRKKVGMMDDESSDDGTNEPR